MPKARGRGHLGTVLLLAAILIVGFLSAWLMLRPNRSDQGSVAGAARSDAPKTELPPTKSTEKPGASRDVGSATGVAESEPEVKKESPIAAPAVMPPTPPVKPFTVTVEKPRSPEGGFFFDHGRYVPPPYRVTTKDYTVVLNESHIIRQFTPPKKAIVGEPNDPGEFHWTEEKLKQRLGYTGFPEHAWAKLDYWVSKYGVERGWQMTVDYYKAQPTVKKVEVVGVASIRIWDTNGDVFSMGYSGRKQMEDDIARRFASSEADAEKRYQQSTAILMTSINEWREGYEKSLASGGAIFVGNHALITVNGANAADVINKTADVLRSNGTGEEKARALTEYLPSPELIKEIIANWAGQWPIVQNDRTQQP